MTEPQHSKWKIPRVGDINDTSSEQTEQCGQLVAPLYLFAYVSHITEGELGQAVQEIGPIHGFGNSWRFHTVTGAAVGGIWRIEINSVQDRMIEE
ncbi:hypothetical protein VNO78_07841 [Psophocarpus tetragonolobus]|uniref:Uncharacterized protein n=1 Tax=Psophocarpus tetragonolobus TaxID=3891 RepID=A0AAN9XT47_PSOTE